MKAYNINFFNEGIDFTLEETETIAHWIVNTIKEEGYTDIEELNIIFCSDDYLLSINQQYLQHDTYTDIISFDNSNDENTISGDIFISIERIRENAAIFKVTEDEELNRVIIHGILHFCGYLDSTSNEKEVMTEKENYYLKHLPNP